MKIAVDYDGTFTEDVDLWWDFIEIAKSRGHTVVICTSRSKDQIIEHEVPCPVVYCNYQPKAECFNADIWIDNDPRWITERIYRR